jgi:hypothetical protein
LNTPEGWFKTQLLFNTLTRLPPKGSLQEWVLILYLDKIESIEHARFRALSQILLTVGADDQNSGVKAFEDYMNEAFPNIATAKRRSKNHMVEVLKEWVGRGPLKVTPLPGMVKKGRSKLVTRISSVEKGPVSDALSKVGRLSVRGG